MTNQLREQVTQWLTGPDTCFLLGAGCSVCAGKPMIGELTKSVLKEANEKLADQFNELEAVGSRPPTIEDLINYLLRYRDILKTLKSSERHPVSVAEIDRWLAYIRSKVVDEVADDWRPNEHHQRFLKRLRGRSQRRPRDIFSLNYDTILEASLDALRIPYVDGFRGTNRAWFDPEVFDDAQSYYRLFKLHGSINWSRDESGHVRRGRNANADAPSEPVVVYPSEQKYLQTQYGVYETLMGRFRERIREPGVNNCLVVLGYSFNDEHINEAICDAVTARASNLTVISFIGPNQDRVTQRNRIEAISERCDARFNAFIGSGEAGYFIGTAVEKEMARAILVAELWRFEKLTTFLAGEPT